MSDNSKRSSGTVFLFVVLAGLVAIYVMARFNRIPALMGTNHPAVGRKFPELRALPLRGTADPVSAADLKDKVVLINLWATWCGPCRKELPELAAIIEQYAHQEPFRALLVSCDEGDITSVREQANALMMQLSLDVELYWDHDYQTQQSALFVLDEPVLGYPTTLVLDGTGTIRGVWQGYAGGDMKDIRALIDQLLEEAANLPSSAESNSPTAQAGSAEFHTAPATAIRHAPAANT